MSVHCPICFEDVCEAKTVCCPNGHRCCEKHHIQRIKAVCETGKIPFIEDGCMAQKCFECRSNIPDNSFSETYFKMLCVTLTIELNKQCGKKVSHVEIITILPMLEVALRAIQELRS